GVVRLLLPDVSENRNRSVTVLRDIEKHLVRSANKFFQCGRIGLKKAFLDQDAALHLHEILLGKSDQLAKPILFRPESKRRRKHRRVNHPALEPAVNRRHHSQAEDRYAMPLERVPPQSLAQQRVGTAAAAAYAHPLSF